VLDEPLPEMDYEARKKALLKHRIGLWDVLHQCERAGALDSNIRNAVNFPEALLPRVPGKTRLAIANNNVPNMVGQISTCLASANINIADLLNKSRGELAYTLIDTDGGVDETLVGKLRRIDGVLSARIVHEQA